MRKPKAHETSVLHHIHTKESGAKWEERFEKAYQRSKKVVSKW